MNKVTETELQDKLGCTVSFKTNSKINLNNKFSLTYKSKIHYFSILNVKVSMDDTLYVKGKEVGYWCNQFKIMEDLDIRDIMGSDIDIITDKAKLERIDAESRYL